MDAEIAVVENETIERGLVAVRRQDMWDEAQERLLCRRNNGNDGIIVTLPANHAAFITNCRFYLGLEKSNKEVACGSNRNGEGFGLLFKEAFAEPNGSEAEREIEVEQ